MSDLKQRFVFDSADIRGCYARLHESVAAIQATHHYPPALGRLINEFAVAAVLLKDSIKVDGSLTIQMRSQGALGLVMADCFTDGRVRAISEYDAEGLFGDEIALNSLPDAIMAITISPTNGERYQSLVPIEHATLGECLRAFFERSEQLPSTFLMFATQDDAVGLSLHALPAQNFSAAANEEAFDHLTVLLNSATEVEALSDNAERLLTKLFHQDQCRLFEPADLYFGCECSLERSIGAIKTLGEEDVSALIKETREEGKDAIEVDCHFCFQRYEVPLTTLTQLN